MYDKNHYNIVISLQLIKINEKKSRDIKKKKENIQTKKKKNEQTKPEDK